MTPSTRHPGHPREDRLEQLLRAGGDVPPGADGADHPDPAGEALHSPTQGWDDTDIGPGTDDRLTRSIPTGRHRTVHVPLLSVPAALRSADLGVGVRAVRGLLVLVVVATLVLGGRWVWTQREAVASPTNRVETGSARDAGRTDVEQGASDAGSEAGGGAPEEQAAAGTAAGAAASRAGAATDGTAGGGVNGETPTGAEAEESETPAAELVVHVAGQVLQPGVVALPAGSRVVDAVRAAGGVTDEADQSTLNLARLLVDGERVWVGRPGEAPPPVPPATPSQPGGAAGTESGRTGGPGGGAPPSTPVDLNAAAQADLEELPGIGPVTAGHILAWREEHGRFSSVDELLEVSGIGERTLAQLAPLVTVGG